jgi:hypothetical protein
VIGILDQAPDQKVITQKPSATTSGVTSRQNSQTRSLKPTSSIQAPEKPAKSNQPAAAKNAQTFDQANYSSRANSNDFAL